ncbi:MAG: methylated-DNA--[protein]-cysteine S-methyltransferase [Amphritea sp.]
MTGCSVIFQSAIGPLTLSESDGMITQCRFTEYQRTEVGAEEEDGKSTKPSPLLQNACRQLEEYFCGKRSNFELPLSPAGTKFQENVWATLQAIPYGETWSYLQLAQQLGNPKASRAVGSANGKNPIWILIPCHRVIQASGGLGGYAGGLDIKARLLDLEQNGIVIEAA